MRNEVWEPKNEMIGIFHHRKMKKAVLELEVLEVGIEVIFHPWEIGLHSHSPFKKQPCSWHGLGDLQWASVSIRASRSSCLQCQESGCYKKRIMTQDGLGSFFLLGRTSALKSLQMRGTDRIDRRRGSHFNCHESSQLLNMPLLQCSLT